MTWVEATLFAAAVVAAAVLVDRARRPERHPRLQDVAWLARALAVAALAAAAATAAAALAGSPDAAQLVAGLGLLACFLLMYLLSRARYQRHAARTAAEARAPGRRRGGRGRSRPKR